MAVDAGQMDWSVFLGIGVVLMGRSFSTINYVYLVCLTLNATVTLYEQAGDVEMPILAGQVDRLVFLKIGISD